MKLNPLKGKKFDRTYQKMQLSPLVSTKWPFLPAGKQSVHNDQQQPGNVGEGGRVLEVDWIRDPSITLTTNHRRARNLTRFALTTTITASNMVCNKIQFYNTLSYYPCNDASSNF